MKEPIEIVRCADVIKPVWAHSLLGEKLHQIWAQLVFVIQNDIEGDCAECGVYRGGTSKLIADTVPHKTLWLFDTFDGIPEAGEHDTVNIGDFRCGGDEVREFLSDNSNVRYCEGVFPESASGLEDKRFCFVHIDFDQYQSTLEALQWFGDRLSKGGCMVIDDYQNLNVSLGNGSLR